LSAGRFRAIPVVTSVAVSVGLVVFAGSLGSSLDATIQAKARLGPGSQQVVDLLHPAPLPSDAPFGAVSTEVVRTSESSVAVRGHEPSDVLGVDPATFARAAFWDDSFADRSLDGLLGDLSTTAEEGAGADVPAVAVGPGLPERFGLRLDGEDGTVDVPVRVVGRADAFPGYGFERDRPLVVVDRAALLALGVTRSPEVWVDSDATDVGERLTAAGLPVRNVLRSDALVQGDLVAQSWALDHIRVMGLAAAAIPVCALGLYFSATAARRRLGTALMVEMGVRRRTVTAATAVEIGALLAGGLLFGVVAAWAAIRLVFDYLDPRPTTPPPALFRYDTGSIVVAAGAVLVITVVVTVVIDRWSSRSPLPELLRRAT
jgi:putative ABC transport system permease protein